MKIIQETPTNLILKQSNFSSLVFGIIFFLIGIGTTILISGQSFMTAIIFGGAFILIGALVVVTAKSFTINIDKTQNKYTLSTVSLISKKNQDVALNQIKEVSLEEYVSQNVSGNSPRNQINYNLVFYLQDGQGILIPINSSSNSFSIQGIPVGGMLGRNKNIVLGNKIATFIGVPFVDRRPPTFTEAISGVIQGLNTLKPLDKPPQTPTTPITPNI